jgi:hypothetical protein
MEITLSGSELFLLTWAICATVYAGLVVNELRKVSVILTMVTLTIRDIAEGKARVEVKDGQVNIERILPLSKNER